MPVLQDSRYFKALSLEFLKASSLIVGARKYSYYCTKQPRWPGIKGEEKENGRLIVNKESLIRMYMMS